MLKKVDYISFSSDGVTHFEENRMSRKLQILLQTSNNVDHEVLFSTSRIETDHERLLPFLHPCMRSDRLIRDMAIDFQRFLSHVTFHKGQQLLQSLKSNDDDTQTTRLYAMQSIKFDGEHVGIPITHVYSTREFHPGNVSRLDTSVRTYSRFDFVEAMYATENSEEMMPGIVKQRYLIQSNNVDLLQTTILPTKPTHRHRPNHCYFRNQQTIQNSTSVVLCAMASGRRKSFEFTLPTSVTISSDGLRKGYRW